MITIGASFSAVTPIAAYVEEKFKISSNRATITSQLLVPCLAQLFNTPIFLLGMVYLLYHNLYIKLLLIIFKKRIFIIILIIM